MDLKAAGWRARWGYYLARRVACRPERLGAQVNRLKEFANHSVELDLDLKRRDPAIPPCRSGAWTGS